ncbi:hypothetical protein [Streptosporangium sp. NPDC020145]|uniref:hypothetical protein n=1 Tax=Streptosporangium sp. NPDC020145 TaxID=3154694 RepID=UPI00342A0266
MTPVEEMRAAARLLRCDHSFPVQPPLGTLWEPGPCNHCRVPWADAPHDIPERLREPLAVWLEAAGKEFLTADWTDCPTAAAGVGVARTILGGSRG